MQKRNDMTEKRPSFGTPEQRGNVTVYPAAPVEVLRAARREKLRAAAYVRVSTDSVQQEGSLSLQRNYYEEYITSNPEYEFAGIYEDDGVSATSVDKRLGFQRMIANCKSGKIDLIFTKSISRFARNVGDLLSSINELNALNPPVEVRFEMEQISTFSPMGEMLITLLGIIAQWESQLKSESITWAVDNLFAKGHYYVFPILGYDKEKGRDNPLIVNEQEAKIVRLCYALTALGYSFTEIAEKMTTLGLSTKSGNTNWTAGGVISLLANEKYAGAVKARKTVTPNYKTHKAKKNEGEKPQYYHENHHTPIVPQLAYDVAQRIIKNRRGNVNGLPCLSAIPEGVLRGYVSVNKNLRGYTLRDYEVASQSVYDGEDDAVINLSADKASIFDLRTYDIVSTLAFEDRSKPSCSISDDQIIFNTACRKLLGTARAEILFHPAKGILALRSSENEQAIPECTNVLCVNKPIHLSRFIPVVLESARLLSDYRYRVYGTRRMKNGESILLFDLRDAIIIDVEKEGYILPDKYAERYGGGYYENLTACGLHKIDIEGLWQALHESRPTDSLAGQIVELTEFCRDSLAEFGLMDETNPKLYARR